MSHKKELQLFLYDVLSHIKDTSFFAKLPEIVKKNENAVFIKLKDGGDRLMKKCNFEEYCKKHFTEHYEEIMNEEVFTLPYPDQISYDAETISQIPFITCLKTMRDWCCKKQKKGTGNGFVFYGYDLYSHLKFLNYPVNILQNNYFDRPCKEIILVYNQVEKLIFLIRKASNRNLDLDIELSTVDMKIFLLVFHDVLEGSGIKLINLLATDGEVQVKCESCKYQVIPMTSLISANAFDKWLEKIKNNFKTSRSYDKILKEFSCHFAAKILGFLASFQYSKEKRFFTMLPSLSDDPVEQMTETILMTREQLDIVYSFHKHLIIKGCYGSGKTIVARKKAEIISHLLQDDDSLWYVICDSRSKLGEEIKLNLDIKVFCNERQMPGSVIIQEILKTDSKKGKLNLILDEFDSETLDETEAIKLNEEFKTNKRLKDSNIILIPQPLEIERVVNSTKKQRNKFEMLESMNPFKLTYNMRNTLKINRLVASTVNTLKEHNPVYLYSPGRTENLSSEGTVNEKETGRQDVSAKRYSNDGVPEVERMKKTKRKRKFSKSKDTNKEETVDCKTLKLDESCDYSESAIEGFKDGVYKTQNMDKIRKQRKLSKSKDMKDDDSTDCKKFQLDEACEYSGSAMEGSSATKMISKFRHKTSDKSGHKKEGKLPNLYEIDYPNGSSGLIIQLMAVLKIIGTIEDEHRLNILNVTDLFNLKVIEKHVILHFDARKDIPDAFDLIFKLFSISDKVTTKYDEFLIDKRKMFFICHYRTFRGLEYGRVIVVLDPSLHHLLHYLPECLNRCTTFLHICVLKLFNSVKTCKTNEPFLGLMKTWKKSDNDEQLVKQWKVECVKDYSETSLPTDSDIITIRGKREEYAELERKIAKCKTKVQAEDWSQRSYIQKEIGSVKQR